MLDCISDLNDGVTICSGHDRLSVIGFRIIAIGVFLAIGIKKDSTTIEGDLLSLQLKKTLLAIYGNIPLNFLASKEQSCRKAEFLRSDSVQFREQVIST